MPNTDIYGLMSVKGGQKQKIMNFSNAREKTYEQYQQLTDAQKKGVIIVDDYPIPEESDSVSVTADGVKNWQTLLNELNSLVDRDKICFSTCLSADGHIFRLVSSGAALYFDAMNNLSSGAYSLCIKLSPNSTYTTWEVKSSGNNYIDNSTTGVPTSGAVVTLIYDYYKNLDIHTEYLAENCMLTGGGNVEDELDGLSSSKVNKSGDTMTGNLIIKRANTSTTAKNSELELGNNIADGTAGSSYGRVIMYGNGTKYTILDALNSTGNRTIHLPDKDGTVALTSDINSNEDIKWFFEHNSTAGTVKYVLPQKHRPALIFAGKNNVGSVYLYEYGYLIPLVNDTKYTISRDENYDNKIVVTSTENYWQSGGFFPYGTTKE